MSKLTDFDEWVCLLDHNLGESKIPDFILYLAETCCDAEQRLEIMRGLLEYQSNNTR